LIGKKDVKNLKERENIGISPLLNKILTAASSLTGNKLAHILGK